MISLYVAANKFIVLELKVLLKRKPAQEQSTIYGAEINEHKLDAD